MVVPPPVPPLSVRHWDQSAALHIQRLVRDSRRSRGAAKDPALADICRDSNALYTRDVTAKRSCPFNVRVLPVPVAVILPVMLLLCRG